MWCGGSAWKYVLYFLKHELISLHYIALIKVAFTLFGPDKPKFERMWWWLSIDQVLPSRKNWSIGYEYLTQILYDIRHCMEFINPLLKNLYEQVIDLFLEWSHETVLCAPAASLPSDVVWSGLDTMAQNSNTTCHMEFLVISPKDNCN